MKIEVGKTYETRMPNVYCEVTIVKYEKDDSRFPMLSSAGYWYSKTGKIAGSNRGADLVREIKPETT